MHNDAVFVFQLVIVVTSKAILDVGKLCMFVCHSVHFLESAKV